VPILSTVMMEPVLRHHFRLGSVVTTVDAVNGLLQAAAVVPSGLRARTRLRTEPMRETPVAYEVPRALRGPYGCF